MSLWDDQDQDDTIKHEIAHALTPGHGHDRVWKAKCAEVGADPTRTWGHNREPRIPRTPPRYTGTCPSGHKHYRRRMTEQGKTSTCARCSSSYNPRYQITWKLNPERKQ